MAAIHGDVTRIHHTRRGATLELSHECSLWSSDCAIEWTIVMPSSLAIDLETGAGDITLSNLDTPRLTAESGHGDDTAEASLRLHTGFGSIGVSG